MEAAVEGGVAGRGCRDLDVGLGPGLDLLVDVERGPSVKVWATEPSFSSSTVIFWPGATLMNVGLK